MSEDPRASDRRRLASLLFYGGRAKRVGSSVVLDVRTLAYFGSMIILVGLAGWLYLYQVTRTTQIAAELRQLEQQQERIHREIVALHAEVALKGALAPVLESEQTEGYHYSKAADANHHLILTVAQNPSDERSQGQRKVATRQERPITGLLDVWRRLLQQVDDWLSQPVMS